MKQLIIFPSGTLSAKDKERMSKEGYLAIEAENPSKVVMPLPAGSVTGDDISMCALEAIYTNGYDSTKVAFTKNFVEMMRARRVASTTK